MSYLPCPQPCPNPVPNPVPNPAMPVPGLPEASKPCAALAWPYRALFTAPILPSPLL